MINARICSGNSLSGVISEYHKSTTKSFSILSMKSFIAASTAGESIFLFHLGGGSAEERRESLTDNCFFSRWDKYVCWWIGRTFLWNSTSLNRMRNAETNRIARGTFIHIDLLVSALVKEKTHKNKTTIKSKNKKHSGWLIRQKRKTQYFTFLFVSPIQKLQEIKEARVITAQLCFFLILKLQYSQLPFYNQLLKNEQQTTPSTNPKLEVTKRRRKRNPERILTSTFKEQSLSSKSQKRTVAWICGR